MSSVKKVLIVGGGIGGLATAMALQKAGIETGLLKSKRNGTFMELALFFNLMH